MIIRFGILLHLLFFLAISIKSIRINPEKALNLRIEACSYRRRGNDSKPLYIFSSEDKLEWCMTLRTNKNSTILAEDRNKTIKLESIVEFEWKPIVQHDSEDVCRVNFKGYQNEYHLAPELGHYPDCQKDLAHYRSMLAANFEQQLTVPFSDIKNINCPLLSFPKSHRQFVDSCNLMQNIWYQLKFDSKIWAETHRKGQYRGYWLNSTDLFLIKPQASLISTGNSLEWLDELVKIRFSVKECKVSLLIELDENWQNNLNLQGYFRYYDNDGKSVSDLILDKILPKEKPWTVVNFNVHSAKQSKMGEFCVNLSLNEIIYTKNNQLRCLHFPVIECCANFVHFLPTFLAIFLLNNCL